MQAAAPGRVEARYGGEQAGGVGVPGGGEDPFGRAVLDDRSPVHDQDPAAGAGHDAHVVGDEHERGAGLAAEPFEQGQDLVLHGGVERGGRLVGEEHVRLVGQREGDHDALAHAAGELVRVVAQAACGIGDADQVEEFGGAAGTAGAPVCPHRLVQVPADREHGVEGRHRVLEDHGDAGTPGAAQPFLVRGGQVLAVEADGPRGDVTARGQHPHERQGGGGLPRAGLADDAEGFARGEREADAAHGPHAARPPGEVDVQVADVEHGGGGRRRGVQRRTPLFRASAMSVKPRTSPVTVINGTTA